MSLQQVWKNTLVGFWAAWVFLNLAPTSTILPIRDLAFEHRMYLPLAGLAVLAVWGGYALLGRVAGATVRRWAGRRWRRRWRWAARC